MNLAIPHTAGNRSFLPQNRIERGTGTIRKVGGVTKRCPSKPFARDAPDHKIVWVRKAKPQIVCTARPNADNAAGFPPHLQRDFSADPHLSSVSLDHCRVGHPGDPSRQRHRILHHPKPRL